MDLSREDESMSARLSLNVEIPWILLKLVVPFK